MAMHLLLLTSLFAPPALAVPPRFVPDARFSLALYCSPTCATADLDAFDAALASMRSKRRTPRVVRRPTRVMGLLPTEVFGRPDPEVLGGLTEGLSERGRAALAASEQVVIVEFSAPLAEALPTLRAAGSAFATLARASGGVVEELETSRLFDAEAFAARQALALADPVDTSLFFVIDSQVVVLGELAEQEDVMALSTRGLRALGLQDLVVPMVWESEVADYAALLNATAQIAFEAGGLRSRTSVSADAIGHAGLREASRGIEGEVRARAADPGIWGEEHPMAEIRFKGRFDAGLPTRRAEPLVEASSETPTLHEIRAMGAPADSPHAAIPAPEAPLSASPASRFASLDEAMAHEREVFRGPVRAAFERGLPSGDILYVKLPFEKDEALEYLWVRVEAWRGGRIEGNLKSPPRWNTGLAPGSPVSADEGAVFDYLLRRADGSSEGNLTEPFLR
jgi:hypothetical protein